jgi:hypothetical protein
VDLDEAPNYSPRTLRALSCSRVRGDCGRIERVMPPTLANGKICYIEIPATDIRRSADFYAKVLAWSLRERGDGRLAFDDAVGEVSGTSVLGRAPALPPKQ